MKPRHPKELRSLFESVFFSERTAHTLFCVKRKVHGLPVPVLGFMYYRKEPNGESHPWMVCTYLKNGDARYFECRYGKFFGRKWQQSPYTDQHNALAQCLHRDFSCRSWRYYEQTQRFSLGSSIPVSNYAILRSPLYSKLPIVADRPVPVLERFSYSIPLA